MERIFKFRVWNHVTQIFYYCDLFDNFWGGLEREKYITQQFTGLLDKNKKEIYEGDFIEAWDFSGNPYFKAEIKFDRGSFVCYNPKWQVQTNFGGYAIPYQVIGNIFENPELLK